MIISFHVSKISHVVVVSITHGFDMQRSFHSESVIVNLVAAILSPRFSERHGFQYIFVAVDTRAR